MSAANAVGAIEKDGQCLSGALGKIDDVGGAQQIAQTLVDRVESLAAAAGVPLLLARLLIARGVETVQEAERFLEPRTEQLHDPFLLTGISEAADILCGAAAFRRRIVVFGDYDVDGVTAVAQLKAALVRAGADVTPFLPHRIRDGYGLRPETVRRVLADHSPAVIVTVDCGITAVEGVACARAAGVEVIVTDHHLVSEELPSGAIVVNPRQPGCPYPEKNLAASGIAMKLALAVAQKAGVRLSVESLLRAACLGTIADLVPLTGENRVLAATGLAALARPKAPGLSALLEECGIEPGRAPTSEEVAFRVAPRLNAAGRLDTAYDALTLFEERDPDKARGLARALTLANVRRQAIERRVVAQARERISQSFDPDRDAVIVEASVGWHRGVLGIAASRLAREYHRPVLLFSLEEQRAFGSGRSIPGVPLHETLRGVGELLDEFGGHDQAVGVTLSASRWPEFQQAARAHFASSIPSERFDRVDEADTELPMENVSEGLLAFLERLEPHGMANPRPIFESWVSGIGPIRLLGDCGARGRLRSSAGDLEWLCWRRALLASILPDSPLEVRYRLGRNRSGRIEIEIVNARRLDTISDARSRPISGGLQAQLAT